VRQARGVLRLVPEARNELVVARVTVVEDLDRDPPAQLLVLSEVDVRHATRTELPHDAVTPVEERVEKLVRRRHSGQP
jgi:hypothetical protein